MSGFVVVLEESSPGVVSFPGAPDAAGLERLMNSQVSGLDIASLPKYLRPGSGTVLGFTTDRSQAEVFRSEAAAQATINRIPPMVRPAGLSVRPLD